MVFFSIGFGWLMKKLIEFSARTGWGLESDRMLFVEIAWDWSPQSKGE